MATKILKLKCEDVVVYANTGLEGLLANEEFVECGGEIFHGGVGEES